MAEDKDDKTEDPTAKRKGEAKKKGQIAQSQDMSSAIMLLAGIVALMIYGGRMMDHIQILMLDSFRMIPTFQYSEDNLLHLLNEVVQKFVMTIYPILLLLLIVGVTGQIFQKGASFYWERLQPKFDKVFNPASVFGQLKKIFFSKDTMVMMLKNIAKMLAIGWVAYDVLKGEFENMLYLVARDLMQMIGLILEIALEIAIKVAVLLLVLGILDFIYQKRKTFNDLKMSKQEVKDEQRMMMGDPKVIAQRKQAMYKMYQQFMMQKVPEATVVITNPTFIAIAIRYNRGEDEVPMVVAKGKRKTAERIRDLATESDIPIVENKALARAMYDEVEPGDGIPAEFFNSVAEVLAYVFSMEGKTA
jgi:flagellar biosynthetic protein FlhB